MWEVKDTVGATMFGSHYMSSFDLCQRKWYLQYLAPHPRGGTGLTPKYTAEPLFIGWLTHLGLAQWYTSTALHHPDRLERCMATMEDGARQRSFECPDNQKYEDWVAQSRRLMERYEEWYGRNEDLKVVLDQEGAPVVEREYRVDFPGGYVFTCRVDALTTWRDWLYVLEHKTTGARRLSALRRYMRIGTQGTGECFVLHKLFPDQKVHGVLLNALVKDAGKGQTPPFLRDPITRSDDQIQQFEWDTVRRLRQIDEQRQEFNALLAQGVDAWEAGRRVFPLTGASRQDACYGFRACEYLPMCEAIGNESGLAAGYRAKTGAPEEPQVEES